ncbi:DUF2905 domain-containing protein [Desulforegula conservatrix]|uniref:DUF2905 domain-containing protein n=1 Tax=Desulforegula conservatrix TaxID=153026 RepID=UPI0003F72C33|nr:DUF2905 domain-containing protein [Desulforegula conservatrix]
MRQILIIAGLLIFTAGILWPWLVKIPFGRLPGDISINRPGFSFYFPVMTMIIISAVISFLMWILRK